MNNNSSHTPILLNLSFPILLLLLLLHPTPTPLNGLSLEKKFVGERAAPPDHLRL